MNQKPRQSKDEEQKVKPHTRRNRVAPPKEIIMNSDLSFDARGLFMSLIATYVKGESFLATDIDLRPDDAILLPSLLKELIDVNYIYLVETSIQNMDTLEGVICEINPKFYPPPWIERTL